MSAICGVIGNLARRPAAEAELKAMLDALAFRAPDGAATWHASHATPMYVVGATPCARAAASAAVAACAGGVAACD